MFYKKDFSALPNEGLKLISNCPLCQAAYNPLSTKVLEEKEDAQLIHIECKRCSGAIVALISLGGLGINSIGLVTDLTPEDVVKFKSVSDVNYNDVIELHEKLEESEEVLKEILASDWLPLAF